MIVSLIMVLEGAPVESVAPRLRRDLPDMVRSNWLLWVPFQFVNFRFVPPQLQASLWGGAGWGRGTSSCLCGAADSSAFSLTAASQRRRSYRQASSRAIAA